MFNRANTLRARSAAKLLLRYPLAIIVLLSAQSAYAEIVVTGNTSNTVYGYGFLGTPFIASGTFLSTRIGGPQAGFESEFGLDFTTTSSNETFFFLQNQYCVGKCTVFAQTTVTLTLLNTGTKSEAMRFDSQITPGHIARLGSNPGSEAVFEFEVAETTAGATRTLYSANGTASTADTSITTSDGVPFNGLIESDNGGLWHVFDWSTTNLNLLLDVLAPGATSTLTYTSLTSTRTSASECVDIQDCAGIQVAFGDPRNNGGGVSIIASDMSLARGGISLADSDDSLEPVIGRLFDPLKLAVDIVPIDTPLPPQPPVLPAVNYTERFVSQVAAAAVPEPADWVLLITGFGMVGAALRQRIPATQRKLMASPTRT